MKAGKDPSNTFSQWLVTAGLELQHPWLGKGLPGIFVVNVSWCFYKGIPMAYSQFSMADN